MPICIISSGSKRTLVPKHDKRILQQNSWCHQPTHHTDRCEKRVSQSGLVGTHFSTVVQAVRMLSSGNYLVIRLSYIQVILESH